MARRTAILACIVVLLSGFVTPLAAAVPASAGTGKVRPLSVDDGRLTRERFVARIYYESVDRIVELADHDLLEYRNAEEGYVLALVDRAEFFELLALGWTVGVDVERTAELNRPREIIPGRAGIPGYECYRTVEETLADAQALVAAHPGLASLLDVGDSWEKTAGLGGYDMQVLRITNSAIPGPKPVLFVTTAIHAREYTTAELGMRFAESLLGGYGVDPDATWLVDHHEIHLMFFTNPDGRKQAEAGELWRKNTNQNYCGGLDRGADLNRNFEFEWGCCGGSSGTECSETYRGPSPASEPEVQAVQVYLRSIFPDQRGPLPTDPAPADATGVYLDIHSHGELVLWPWGFSGTAPNDAELTTLGRRLAYFNGYTPQQGIDLYPTDGTTDDFGYGDLGVASFTFELGTAFFQDCPTFESSIAPENLPALYYAARVADAPYRLPAGPDAATLSAVPALVDPGAPVAIQALLDDDRSENGNGVEPSQSIAAAELYVDTPPWSAGATPVPMVAADGTFDATAESVTATLDTTGWTPGRRTVFVRGQDTLGHWGPVRALFVYVKQGNEGTISGSVVETGTAAPLAAQVDVQPIGVQVATDPATGAYSVQLPDGDWTLVVSADDHLTATFTDVPASTGSNTSLDVQLDPVPPILLVDDDDNGPDVRAAYTGALDALGESYFVWDTANSDHEPDAAFLRPFDVVIWMTGDEYGGVSGPGNGAETALGDWLDRGRCLLVSSQDYYYDRGLTSFNQTYLGLQSATSDVSQTTVTGQGTVFGGFGPYALSFPYSNYTDTLVPDATAEVAFAGTSGDAAIDKDTGWYRTSFWSFGLETVAAAADREALLAQFLGWCGGLAQADGDGDGIPNAGDCAPLNALVWQAPGSPTALTLGSPTRDDLSWSPPLDPGGPGVVYDLLRSDVAPDVSGAVCVVSGQAALTAGDAALPAPGAIFFYRVRARNTCGESPDGGPLCP